MRRLALQGSPRRLLTRLHRWSGLTIMALVTIAGLSGGILVFRDDIERRVNPHLTVVPPMGQPASLRDVIDRVEERFLDARVSTVTLPPRPDASLIAYLTAKPGAREGPAISEVFVNPYTTEILGQRRAGQILLGREYLIPLLARLHSSLLLGSIGASVMGSAAIVWLLSSVIGLALAWPAAWRHATGWWQTCVVRRRDGAFKMTYDVHRSFGVLLLPIWIVLAFTSVYLSFPNGVRSLAAVLSPVTPSPPGSSRWDGGPIVPPDEAVAAALAAVPAAAAFGFTRDFTHGRYSVRLMLPDDVNPAGNSHAYVDFATGRVMAISLAADASRGRRFLYWQFPLHTGDAFGAPGRIGIALSALALVTMCMTGLYLWLRGWTVRRATTRAAVKETRQ